MSLWILLTLLMTGVIAVLGWAAWRPIRASGGSSDAVYIDQLREIDREAEAGLIDEADARMARLELQRRLLQTGTANKLELTEMNMSDRIIFAGSFAAIAIGSAIIYAAMGQPGAPAHPAGRGLQSVMVADPGNLSTRAPSQGAQATQTNLPSVDSMIGRLEQRLADAPDDVEGWRMLGWSKFKTGDTAGAAAAYERALELDPDDGRIQSVYGEALILSNGGFVTDKAESALRAAVQLDPSDARARFLLGLKKQQDGKPEGALDDWIKLLEDAPADADWYEDVRGRAVELAASSGIDVSDRLPAQRSGAIPAAATPASQMSSSGPTQQQVEAASELSAEEREAMILGMVERLEARLEAEPGNLEGWERLIRSRLVLRQEDQARQAYERAQNQFSGDQNALSRLQAALQTQP